MFNLRRLLSSAKRIDILVFYQLLFLEKCFCALSTSYSSGGFEDNSIESDFSDSFTSKSSQRSWSRLWERANIVPQKITEAPQRPLFMSYPPFRFINLNDIVRLKTVTALPSNFYWKTTGGNDLYTVLLQDLDLPPSLCNSPSSDCRFLHYLSFNIPAVTGGKKSKNNKKDISKGDTVLSYLPPSPAELGRMGSFVTKLDPDNHRYLWLVFRQQAFISMNLTSPECGAGTLSARTLSRESLSSLFQQLGFSSPVAGTFWRVGEATEESLQQTCCLLECEVTGQEDLLLAQENVEFPLQEPPELLGLLEDACFEKFGLFTCS